MYRINIERVPSLLGIKHSDKSQTAVDVIRKKVLEYDNKSVWDTLNNAYYNERVVHKHNLKLLRGKFHELKIDHTLSYKQNYENAIKQSIILEYINSLSIVEANEKITGKYEATIRKEFQHKKSDNLVYDSDAATEWLANQEKIKKSILEKIQNDKSMRKKYGDFTISTENTKIEATYEIDGIKYKLYGQYSGVIIDKNGKHKCIILIKNRDSFYHNYANDAELRIYTALNKNKVKGILVQHLNANGNIRINHRKTHSNCVEKWLIYKPELDQAILALHNTASTPFSKETLRWVDKYRKMSFWKGKRENDPEYEPLYDDSDND